MEKIIKLGSNEEAISLYGSLDERLRYAEETYKVRISARNHRLVISGTKDNVKSAVDFFMTELERIRDNGGSTKKAGTTEITLQRGEGSFFHKGKIVKAKSKNQDAYLQAIQPRLQTVFLRLRDKLSFSTGTLLLFSSIFHPKISETIASPIF